MIELTKLNGDNVLVNERWIESVEEFPDTTITLSSGNKFVVLERLAVVREKILAWHAEIRKKAGGPVKKNTTKKK